jgi:hypothetical protein
VEHIPGKANPVDGISRFSARTYSGTSTTPDSIGVLNLGVTGACYIAELRNSYSSGNSLRGLSHPDAERTFKVGGFKSSISSRSSKERYNRIILT